MAFLKRMAGMGHLKRICKDACRVAGAVQKTCSSEMLGGQGQGADFLKRIGTRPSALQSTFHFLRKQNLFVFDVVTCEK